MMVVFPGVGVGQYAEIDDRVRQGAPSCPKFSLLLYYGFPRKGIGTFWGEIQKAGRKPGLPHPGKTASTRSRPSSQLAVMAPPMRSVRSRAMDSPSPVDCRELSTV